MNLIKSIEEFREKYDDSGYAHYRWFDENQCSMDVLEYYVSNFKCDWYKICLRQPLTEKFIMEHIDNIKVHGLVGNTSVNLSLDVLEYMVYSFNLYELHNIISDLHINGETGNKYEKQLNIWYNLMCKLKDKYPHKYQIDKLSHKLNS